MSVSERARTRIRDKATALLHCRVTSVTRRSPVPALLACFSSLLSSCESQPFFSECSSTRERKRACVALTLLRSE